MPRIYQVSLFYYLLFSWIMGSVNNPQQSDLFNWIQIQSHRFLNQSTKQLIDHSQVSLFNEDDVKSYSDRLKIVRENIPQLYYFRRVFDCENGCTHNYCKLDVFVQGGLDNITDFIQNNKLYKYNKKCYCNDIVQGFQFLKQKYGAFEVSLPMIWVDSTYKVKLWINESLFLNSFKTAKESVMILQIKQILIKLQCKCNIAFEEELSFSTLKEKKRQNISFFPYQVKYNQTIPGVIESKDTSFNRQNIFYYPSTPTTVKIQKVIQNISFQNKSNAKIIQAQNESSASAKMINIANQGKRKVENTKNYSAISIPSKVSIKYSTPKISHNQHQSTKVTPLKLDTSSRHVEMISTEQNSSWKDNSKNDRFMLTALKQKADKISQNKSEVNVLLSKKKSSKKSLTYMNGNTKNFSIDTNKNGSKEEKIVPFTLHSKQQLKELTLSRTKLKNILKEKKFKQKDKPKPKVEAEGGKKGVYQNSFTQRQVMQPQKNLYTKPRNSVEIEKLDAKSEHKIQYEVPEKMKRIIQKYMSDKEDSKSSIKSSQNSYQYHNANRTNKLPSNRNESIINKYPRLSIQEQDEFAKTDQENSDPGSRIQLENQELEDDIGKSNSKQGNIKNTISESIIREYRKKPSEKVYTQIQDEQETKIRKKVAEKKAIFADLKAEASKILQSRVELGY